MAKTFIDFVTNDAPLKADLEGDEVVWMGDTASIKGNVTGIIAAVKALDGGPVSRIPSLLSVISASAAAILAETGGPLRMTEEGLVVVGVDPEWLTAVNDVLSGAVTETIDESGAPIKIVTPGYLKLTQAGTLAISDVDTTGMATQAWVTQQINESVGSISFPAETFTRDVAEEAFWMVEEFGDSGLNLARATSVQDVLAVLPRHLRYAAYSDFPQPATSSAPFSYNAFNTGGAIAAGTPETGRSGLVIIPGGTSANGGARFGGRRDGMVLVPGSDFSIKFKPLSVVDETFWIGFHNANTNTVPTDYAMFLMAPGGAITYGVRVASGTATSAGSATLSANQWYQADVTVTAAGVVRFLLREDDLDGSGATIINAVVTTALPTAAIGGHIAAFTSYANATPRNVCLVDDIGLSESGVKI